MVDDKSIISKYNKSNAILLISSYPERQALYSEKVCALGGFARNTVYSLRTYFKDKEKEKKIIVLTVTTGKKEVYIEDNILIIRIFTRNRISSYLSLIRWILRFNRVHTILIEFEFASFGNTKITTLFPLILFLLRMLRKKTTLVLHQVVSDIGEITGHVGYKRKTIKIPIFNTFLKFYYKALTLFPQTIVVLEEIFKKRLKEITHLDKVIVIPHGVDVKVKTLSKKKAREKLGIKDGDFVALYFGYLTWYKGVDWLVRQMKNIKNTKLIVAGGESFTQKEKPHYQKFIKKVYRLAAGAKNITITGFVNEKDISLYFCACDFVVFPYRSMLSSSGPLSFAFSFGKPIFLSDKLNKYLKTKDFSSAIKDAKLKKQDIFFSLYKEGLEKKLSWARKKSNLHKLAIFSKLMKKRRAWETSALSDVIIG